MDAPVKPGHDRGAFVIPRVGGESSWIKGLLPLDRTTTCPASGRAMTERPFVIPRPSALLEKAGARPKNTVMIGNFTNNLSP
jgi:hypothetical protein